MRSETVTILTILGTRVAKPCILAVLCVLAASQLRAGTPHASFRSYGQDQGLGNLSVQAIDQDKDGFLWVATQAGLYRYDGSNFESMDYLFPGTPGVMTQLYLNSEGQLWAGAAGGLYYFDAGRFHAITADGKALPMIANSRVTEFGGQMAVVSGGELYLIRNNNQAGSSGWNAARINTLYPQVKLPKPIYGIAADASGSLWVGCGMGICHLTGDHVTVLTVKDGIPIDVYSSLTVASSKAIWVRGIRHILRREPGAQGNWTDESKQLGESRLSNFYHAMVEDGRGNLMTALVDGLAIWSPSGWQSFGRDQGLPSTDIAALYRDQFGDIWIGLQGRGLLKWKGYGNWDSYTQREGLPSEVIWGIISDGTGGIYLGTNHGLAHLPANSERVVPIAGTAEVQGPVYGVVQAKSGDLWFTTDHRLYRLKNGRLDSIAMPDTTGRLSSDGDSLWMTTFSGLYTHKLSDSTMKLERYEPMGKQAVGQLATGKNGEKWAVAGDGIYHLGPWGVRRVKLSAGDNRFNTITVDRDGALWVGGSFPGISRLKVVNDVVVSRDNFQPPIIGSRQIDEISMDHRGWLWVSGDHGLDILHDGLWSSLTEEDGLVWNDTNSSGFLEAADGSIYVGTSGGLTHLLHPLSALIPSKARVVILGLEVDGKQLEITPSVELASAKGSLTIHVGSTELRNEHAVRIKYRSPGIIDDWLQPVENFIRMPRREPRHVELEFLLTDSAGRPQSSLTKLSITTLPPWWRTPFAYLAYLLLLVGIIVEGWLWRTRHLRARQRELERLVASRTVELAEKNQVLEATRQELQIKATFDSLTGLYNRGAFIEMLERDMNRSRRENSSLVLAICDIDHFKMINDQYGHLFGDDVLISVGKRLSETLRDYDICGRYGGEELILLLPGIDAKQAEERIQQIQIALSTEYYCVEDKCVPLTVSIGFTSMEAKDDVRAMVFRADTALYRAKAAGRNCVRYVGIPMEGTPTAE